LKKILATENLLSLRNFKKIKLSFWKEFFMQAVSNFKINGAPTLTAGFTASLTAALGTISVTTGLLAAIRLLGRVDSALDKRGAGLSYNLRDSLSHGLLGQIGVRHSGRGWQGRDLHSYPLAFPRIAARLLSLLSEKTINHSVMTCVLDNCLKRLGKCRLQMTSVRKERP
jgi:hypothetical protein